MRWPHCGGFPAKRQEGFVNIRRWTLKGKPKIWTPCPLWTGFTHSVLICDHHQRRMLGLGNLTAHRALQIGPSCHPGWRNTEKVRRTWRTWKRFKTSTRWLKTLYLWFKTIFCWLKTLYLSTRWLKTLYYTLLGEPDPWSAQTGTPSSEMCRALTAHSKSVCYNRVFWVIWLTNRAFWVSKRLF